MGPKSGHPIVGRQITRLLLRSFVASVKVSPGRRKLDLGSCKTRVDSRQNIGNSASPICPTCRPVRSANEQRRSQDRGSSDIRSREMQNVPHKLLSNYQGGRGGRLPGALGCGGRSLRPRGNCCSEPGLGQRFKNSRTIFS